MGEEEEVGIGWRGAEGNLSGGAYYGDGCVMDDLVREGIKDGRLTILLSTCD
jgi:hypothetical protein